VRYRYLNNESAWARVGLLRHRKKEFKNTYKSAITEIYGMKLAVISEKVVSIPVQSVETLTAASSAQDNAKQHASSHSQTLTCATGLQAV
jgi:hypothetical protein